MRIKYNILWIENDLGWQQAAERLISDEIEDLGFVLNTTVLKSQNDLNKLMETMPNLKRFDFILVDYKLDNGSEGNVLIERIRENKIYTDILFYSQEIAKLREIFAKQSLQGVYLSSRDNFEEVFTSVRDKNIRKIEEINTLRGLVMAETSHLDNLVEEILIAFFESDSVNKDKIRSEILKKIRQSFKSNCNRDGTLKLARKTDSEIVTSRIFEASKKARTIKDLLEIELGESKSNFFEEYKEEILDVRNKLAHVKAVEKGGVEYLVYENKEETEYKEFKQEDFIVIRKNLLKYDTVLNDIKEKINNKN